MVQHSNGHLLNASRKVIELAGITSSTDVEGVMKDDSGQPTGELGEMAAQYMAYKVADNVRRLTVLIAMISGHSQKPQPTSALPLQPISLPRLKIKTSEPT